MMRYLIVLYALLIFGSSAVNAAQADTSSALSSISVYFEPKTTANHPRQFVESVLQHAIFSPVNQLRVPYYDGVTWVRIIWPQGVSPAWLINNYTSLDHETVFVLKDGRVLRTIKGGNTRRFDSRSVPYHKLLSDIHDADSVLIRVNQQFVPLMFQLLQSGKFEQQQLSEMMWYVSVYAIVFVMIFYNLFIYVYLRESRYLYYCFYLVAMLFTQLRLSGLGKQYLWPNVTNYTSAINIFSTVIVTISGILFFRAFLDPRYSSPLKHRALSITALLCGVTFMLYWLKPILPIMAMVSVISSQIMLAISLVVIYAVIISHLISNDRSARVLMVTYTVLNIASFITLMRHNGLIKNTFFVEHALDIAVVFEAVVLSLALAGKIQQLRQEKIAAEVQQRQQQQHFSRHLLNVQEAEKKNIGNALHDNYTHQLLLLKESIANKLGRDAQETHHVSQMLHDIRRLSHIIHPYMLENLGLKAAINAMIEDIVNTHALDINTSINELEVDAEQRILVYRIVQECLNNIIKHANASECLIVIHAGSAVKHTDHKIVIKDDGKGFEPAQASMSLGLTTLRERVQMLCGTLAIRSAINGKTQGTAIYITFPVSLTQIGDVV